MGKTKEIVLVINSSAEEFIIAAAVAYAQKGVVLPNAHVEDPKTFMQCGRVPDCDCRLIECVCLVARQHKAKCQFRKALTCAVAIACDHGRDVCPICDACTCKPVAAKKRASKR